MTRFGYACLNTQLAEEGVNPNRGMIRKTWLEKGLPHASQLALLNCQDLLKMVRWNRDQGVQVFRITSSLFPWSTEYELVQLPDWDRIQEVLEQTGAEARAAGQRLSFHPGQYNVLASPTEKVVENSIRDLRTHGEVFDWMEMPRTPESKINLHVGGSYGDPDGALERFCRNFERLPDSVQSRLTVENDDRASLFSVAMLHEGVTERLGVPIVFDSHHWELGPQDQPYEEALRLAASSWGALRSCCHHSNSRKLEDPTAPAKAHSDWYHTPFDSLDLDVDVVLESKMKERALERYLQDFPVTSSLQAS